MSPAHYDKNYEIIDRVEAANSNDINCGNPRRWRISIRRNKVTAIDKNSYTLYPVSAFDPPPPPVHKSIE